MDPRIARTRRTVIDTATDLLVEGGPSALTMDAVVARSGVAKSTLYRHWATRDELVAEVFSVCAPQLDEPAPDATFEEALATIVHSVARSFGHEQWRRLFPALILLADQQSDLHTIDADLKAEQHRAAEDILRRGVDEGALDPSILDDIDRSIALLIGPILIAGLIARMSATEVADIADAALAQFLTAHRPAL